MKPQVKESEKNRVLSTQDYNLFVMPDYRISRKFLNQIKESIQEKNLSKDYPILVENKTYKIIDGRYRFIACKGLRFPIYYFDTFLTRRRMRRDVGKNTDKIWPQIQWS